MRMPATDRERMCALYEERFAEHGVSPESLGWTKGRQDIRFNALLNSLEGGGDSFLDIGCGFGDLNDALVARGRPYRYLGVDVVENFVNEGVFLILLEKMTKGLKLYYNFANLSKIL